MPSPTGHEPEAALPALPQPPHTASLRGNGPRAATVPHPPGSKYYTLRYVLDAFLAEGESLVRGAALSADTAVLVRAIRALGGEARWQQDASGWSLRVRGCGGLPRLRSGATVDVGNAGAVLRLLLGIGALLPEVRFATDHPESLGRRPNADLLAALERLGIQIDARGPEGLLPITLRGGPPRGGLVSVSGARSSQYLSALLYLAPLLPDGLEITVTQGLKSAPLVRATLRALRAAGIRVESQPDLLRFHVPGGQAYRAGIYDVPGDGPSAAALAAAALVSGRWVRLERLRAEEDDVRAMLAALESLGAALAWSADGSVTVSATGPLHGAEIDGDACIDSVPALAAVACFAHGETRFTNVATLRLKESDRITDLCAGLRAVGCDAVPLPDAIIVRGRPEGVAGGATVDGHDDHRLVQALAIAALRARDGLTISGADAVAKSYPWFFDDLAYFGALVS